MNLPTFNAYVRGYQDHLLDLKILSIQAGYWAGYYTSSSKPKSLDYVIDTTLRNYDKVVNKQTRKSAETVDVNTFLEREQKFREVFGE